MEMNKSETTAVAKAAELAGEVRQLEELQLTLVGGGCADPAFI